MSCNCENNLSENVNKPEGMKAILSEYKVPICVSGVAIGGVLLYNKFGRKKKRKKK
jgi:hypothetical protein